MMDRSEEIISRIQLQCPAYVTVDHPWFMEALDELDKELPAALVWISGVISIISDYIIGGLLNT